MTVTEFHKRFEEELAKYPSNFPELTLDEWKKIGLKNIYNSLYDAKVI